MDLSENGCHVCKNLPGSEHLAWKIYKQDIHTGTKEVLLPAIAFTEAALEEIALDGALEVAFWDGDDDAGRGVIVPFQKPVTDASVTACLPMGEKLRYPGKAGEPFTLWKGCCHY